MAESPVLADSSYYIGLLRQGVDPLRTLAVAAATRDLVICSIVRCEVARGIVIPGVLKKFQNFWDVMINVPTDHRLWEEVERMVWRLDRTGNVLPLTDIVIACCALRINAVVLTHDRHFTMIPGVRVVNRLDV
jgi:predicted nucleic acid-binding protein